MTEEKGKKIESQAELRKRLEKEYENRFGKPHPIEYEIDGIGPYIESLKYSLRTGEEAPEPYPEFTFAWANYRYRLKFGFDAEFNHNDFSKPLDELVKEMLEAIKKGVPIERERIPLGVDI